MAACNIEGCVKEAKQKGWCWAHYTRWRRYGDPLEAKRVSPNLTPPEKCIIDGCDKKHLAKGLCAMHYNRVYRHGDTDARLAAATGDHLRWLRGHIGFDGGGCLYWPFKAKTAKGYAVTTFDGVAMNASRAMCILARGEPPTPEHEAAHSCGKGHEGCVHPGHLRWATTSENHADKKVHGTYYPPFTKKGVKLTDDDVRAIRSSDEPQSVLGKRYGVHPSYIWELRTYKRRLNIE